MEIQKTTPGSLPSTGFNPFPLDKDFEKAFPSRDDKGIKLQAADLFSLFTADIITEQVSLPR